MNLKTIVITAALCGLGGTAIAQAPAYGPPAYGPPPPNYYQPAPLQREGFTIELELGIGDTYLAGNDGSSESHGSLGGLDLALGGFLNNETALLFRISGTTYVVGSGSDQVNVSNVFVGPAVQYWAGEHVFVGGGIGGAVLSGQASNGDHASLRGFGVEGRVGYAFSEDSVNAWHVSAELNNGSYDGGNATSIAFLIGWQHL
ncbi:MAG TPA: hypothetical protein VL463_15930 [Kofleriaceae bacterium]|jgi:hypothetical protein|nr:hypothetical protein [Kofleriaceae bacterium]